MEVSIIILFLGILLPQIQCFEIVSQHGRIKRMVDPCTKGWYNVPDDTMCCPCSECPTFAGSDRVKSACIDGIDRDKLCSADRKSECVNWEDLPTTSKSTPLTSKSQLTSSSPIPSPTEKLINITKSANPFIISQPIVQSEDGDNWKTLFPLMVTCVILLLIIVVVVLLFCNRNSVWTEKLVGKYCHARSNPRRNRTQETIELEANQQGRSPSNNESQKLVEDSENEISQASEICEPVTDEKNKGRFESSGPPEMLPPSYVPPLGLSQPPADHPSSHNQIFHSVNNSLIFTGPIHQPVTIAMPPQSSSNLTPVITNSPVSSNLPPPGTFSPSNITTGSSYSNYRSQRLPQESVAERETVIMRNDVDEQRLQEHRNFSTASVHPHYPVRRSRPTENASYDPESFSSSSTEHYSKTNVKAYDDLPQHSDAIKLPSRSNRIEQPIRRCHRQLSSGDQCCTPIQETSDSINEDLYSSSTDSNNLPTRVLVPPWDSYHSSKR